MDGVRLTLESDGTYSWHCEKCGMSNTEEKSFLGFVCCQTCYKSSVVVEVIR